MVERRMTLLEVAIASVVLAVAMGLFLIAFGSSADTVSVTGARTHTLVESERAVNMVATELTNASLSAPDGVLVSPSGLQAGGPDDTILFTALEGYDPADPLAVVWGERRKIQFEADAGEIPLNGVDDDGDMLVDEGRVALYRVTPGGDVLMVVLLRNVSRFSLRLDPGPAQGRPSVEIELALERIIRAGVRSSASLEQARTGGGPRSRHTARRRVSLVN